MSALQRYIPAYAILSVAALLIVPVAALEPLWISIIAVLAAAAAILGSAGRGEWPRLHRTLTWLLTAFVVWGAISAVWSIAPDRSVSQSARLLLVAIGTTFLLSAALSLDLAGRKILEAFLIVGVALGLLFMLFEFATGGIVHGVLNSFEKNPVQNLFELNRASSVVSIITWVVIIPVWRRFGWIGAAILILLTIFIVTNLQPSSPVLSMIVVAGLFPLAWHLRRLSILMLSAAIASTLISIPFIAALTPIITRLIQNFGFSEFSLLHRLAIWEFASQRVLIQPVFGWGLDSSRILGTGNSVGIKDAPEMAARTVDALPLHPHNALLQVWLELGAVGALLFSGFFIYSLFIASRYIKGNLEFAAVFSVIATIFVNAQLSFGIWQGWWLTFICLVVAITTALVRNESNSRP